MSTLICPVTRKVATDAGPTPVLCELVNWSGVALMIHETPSHRSHILGMQPWSCSHERTGWRVATGPSPETALAVAVEKLRRNYSSLRGQVEKLPVLNP